MEASNNINIAEPSRKVSRFRAATLVAAVGTAVLSLVDFVPVYKSSAIDIHYADRLVALIIAIAMCAVALFLVAQASVEVRRFKSAYLRFPVAVASAVFASFLIPFAQLVPAVVVTFLCSGSKEACRNVLGPIFAALIRTANQSNFTTSPLWLASIVVACVLLARRDPSDG
jgi:hypothetical protein